MQRTKVRLHFGLGSLAALTAALILSAIAATDARADSPCPPGTPCAAVPNRPSPAPAPSNSNQQQNNNAIDNLNNAINILGNMEQQQEQEREQAAERAREERAARDAAAARQRAAAAAADAQRRAALSNPFGGGANASANDNPFAPRTANPIDTATANREPPACEALRAKYAIGEPDQKLVPPSAKIKWVDSGCGVMPAGRHPFAPSADDQAQVCAELTEQYFPQPTVSGVARELTKHELKLDRQRMPEDAANNWRANNCKLPRNPRDQGALGVRG